MLYRHLTANCLESGIGDRGLSRAALEGQLAGAAAALDRLRRIKREGGLPVLDLPRREDDLAACAAAAARLTADCGDVVILGTGGSSLGGRTITALADRGFGPTGGRPRLHFAENVDPDSFEALLGALDLARTGVVVISKSGGTSETVMQLLALLPHLLATLGPATLAERVVAITEPVDNPLRALAQSQGFAIIDHDPGVGGRFSALSVTGVLPAIMAGLDAAALRRGAAAVLDHCLAAEDPAGAPPALGAALAVGLLRERQIATTVLMPYIDRLANFGLWYRQLWAESLGKGGAGTTPIRALGTVDQHSQLQLYLDGPADKLFTLVTLETAGRGPKVESDYDLPALGLYRDRRLGDLIDAMGRATAETLARRGRPVRLISLDRLDEEVLGGLMMHFILETIIAADLFGVDPFGQPAVEEGKILARAHMEALGQN